MLFERGAIIGILGGGQLGRMTSQVASRLGYRCHIYAAEADGPAAQVSYRQTVGSFGDMDALDAFADQVDVVTLEWENVPLRALRQIAARVPLWPRPETVAQCQDRLLEKEFCEAYELPVVPYAEVNTLDDLEAGVARLGRPCVLKTRRMGYDGKGQEVIGLSTELTGVWHRFGGKPCILEQKVELLGEVSVIVCRSQDGQIVCYPAIWNEHRDHVLWRSRMPAPVDADLAWEADRFARTLAVASKLVGVLAVEMFITPQGLLVNELAPRPHNSGHLTIEACETSQFEQLVRAVVGAPLGSPRMLAEQAHMLNLLGDEIENIDVYLRDPRSKLHDYGKAKIEAGRKMGHVTRLSGVELT